MNSCPSDIQRSVKKGSTSPAKNGEHGHRRLACQAAYDIACLRDRSGPGGRAQGAADGAVAALGVGVQVGPCTGPNPWNLLTSTVACTHAGGLGRAALRLERQGARRGRLGEVPGVEGHKCSG